MSKKKQSKKAQPAPSLLKELVRGILVSHWLVTCLAALFVISSMSLAMTSHKNRRMTAEWQKMRELQQDQQMTSDALRLELTSLSEADRISNLARKELGMVEVSTKNEKVISL